MALLSAEDVLNKTFQATKFREGYDQDEVDDFLDEVVGTIRALTAENGDLKQKLAAAEGRIAELTRGAAPTDVHEGVVESAPLPEPVPEPEPVSEPVVEVVAEPVADEPAGPSEPEAATGMLALAAKLHDEYVQEGKSESERLVSEATEKANQIVADAEKTSAETMSKLDQERALLERKIDELRIFERDYRTRLRSYLENLLGDLENRASAMPNSTIPEQLQ
jgi:DivIVA domain-containing protein